MWGNQRLCFVQMQKSFALIKEYIYCRSLKIKCPVECLGLQIHLDFFLNSTWQQCCCKLVLGIIKSSMNTEQHTENLLTSGANIHFSKRKMFHRINQLVSQLI